MEDLSKYRERIDAIDQQLMSLFEERMEQVLQVARYKKANNLPVFQKNREQEVIKKNLERLTKPHLASYAELFLQQMMDVSKSYQSDTIGIKEVEEKKIVLGFQGVPGSFSEEALVKYFGENYETVHYDTFEAVFEAIKYGYIQYGVLPIENSTTGSITQNYDLLKKYGYSIIGETNLKIEQHLLGLEGSTLTGLREVYSHPQGIEQSSDYLKTLPQCKSVPYLNTAMSAKLVKESDDTTKAAIGSRRAADLYGLEILKASINNAKENVTRFIVVGKYEENNRQCNKMTLVFTLGHQAGTLHSILNEFANEGINLLKIESRPVGDGSFSYFFYTDIEGNKEDSHVQKVLDRISRQTQGFQCLGCYKKSV